MMGTLAKSVLDHGGEVTGIIPEFLVAREHAMRGADNLIVTRDMHERKRKMFEMADAFVAPACQYQRLLEPALRLDRAHEEA